MHWMHQLSKKMTTTEAIVMSHCWQLVESVVKEPGLVWKHKMPHEVEDQVKGLFFMGDSTISYGIGTNSAAHSASLCYEKVLSYLSSK